MNMINISFFHATNRICIQPLYITEGEDRCVISMTADLRGGVVEINVGVYFLA